MLLAATKGTAGGHQWAAPANQQAMWNPTTGAATAAAGSLKLRLVGSGDPPGLLLLPRPVRYLTRCCAAP